jgi:hypothetical protein
MDPLNIASAALGFLTLSGTTISTGYTLIRSFTADSQDLLRQLLTQLAQLTGIVVALQAQQRASSQSDQTGLSATSLKDCQALVTKISHLLEKLSKTRKGVLTLKWLAHEGEVKRMIQDLEYYKTMFILLLGVDVR